MELKMAKTTLLKQLNLLSGIVKEKATIPILSHLALTVDVSGRVTIRATNLDIHAQTSFDVDECKAGEVVVSGPRLIGFVKSLPDGDVSIKLGAGGLHVAGARSKAKFPADWKMDKFPVFPDVASLDWTAIDAKKLLPMIDRVKHAVTKEESKWALMCIRLILGDGRLKVIATNGHVLGYTQTDSESSFDADVLITSRAVPELALFLDDVDTVDFGLIDTSAHTPADREAKPTLAFRAGGRVMTIRQVIGVFPNQDLVLDYQRPHGITVDAKLLSDGISRVAQVADDGSQCISMHLKGGDEAMIGLEAKSSISGHITDAVPMRYSGPDVSFGFNYQYVLDALRGASGDIDVSHRWTSPENAGDVEFVPRREDGITERQIVYPMRPQK